MTEPGAGPRVRRLEPDEWRLWREVRLRALADSPDAFGSLLADEERLGEEDWRRRLEQPAVVVLDAGRAVACGAAFGHRPGYVALAAMWVDPDHRGLGLSRVVLDWLVRWAKQAGLAVELDVNRANPVARAAYDSYGFVATGRHHPLRDGSDQVCDVLEIRPG